MARYLDREKALLLRKKGKSYSQIKQELGISKSTLHYWLKDHPLSEQRIRELRDWSEKRIENFRRTMELKRVSWEDQKEIEIRKLISTPSKRELLISGFFLYWAEGTKTSRYTVALTNTDPAMLCFFIKWLAMIGIERKMLRVRLHIYTDMDEKKQIRFWASSLNLPASVFSKTYIKKSFSKKRKDYKGRFGQGTCSVLVHSRDLAGQIHAGMKVIREFYTPTLQGIS